MNHANTTKHVNNGFLSRGVLCGAKLKTTALQNIIKLLVIVLSLNSINGFAACCLDMNKDIDSAVENAVESAVDSTADSESPKQSMPCHQSSIDKQAIKLADQKNFEESNSVDSCCNACAFTALPIALLISASTESPEFIPTAFSEFVSLTAAPLFRPPIFSLS